MPTVKATWTGYLGRAADGTVLVPGAVVEVDEAVARANPHYSIPGGSDGSDAAAKAQADVDQARVLAEQAAAMEAAAQAEAVAVAQAEVANQTGAVT